VLQGDFSSSPPYREPGAAYPALDDSIEGNCYTTAHGAIAVLLHSCKNYAIIYLLMADSTKRPNLLRALRDLQRRDEARRQAIQERVLDPGLALLRAWQSQRLARTYADLLENPEFGAASRFFLSDIYGPRDFSQRDHDFERLHSLLARFLPAQSLQLLGDALEMNRLSADLDQHLLEALVERLGVTDEITPELYADGYRICDNYTERERQIEQTVRIIREIGAGARLPLVGVSLRLARKPAEAAGWFELYDFLERGYAAFRPMKAVDTFATTIDRRERQILERIFTGESDPFYL
jgi:hypothetical protein